MAETTRRVFEQYEVRKTRKQKTAFIEYVKSVAESYGYEANIEKGSFGARNIVIGDADSAGVVYTAHYDTCVRLPFPNFITPKNVVIYLLYQLAITVLLLLLWAVSCAVVFLLMAVISALLGAEEFPTQWFGLIMFVLLYGDLLLMMFGPANKHTANDNTSGVTTLLDIMAALPAEDRDKAAFVFFDLEETGLMGSSSFASKHKKSMKNKLVVNFDCVSDGENILFALKRGAGEYKAVIEDAFRPTETVKVDVAEKGVFYPSDNVNFKCGVGVAALKKSKKFGFLYMDRIHTKKDTVYREENIEFLKDGALKLVKLI